jgi:vacuolar-type H+-ATPase subunit H
MVFLMSAKIQPRKSKDDEDKAVLDDVGRTAPAGNAAAGEDAKKESIANDVGATLKTPSGAILVPGAEIVKDAQRKKDAVIAEANNKADALTEQAKKAAAAETEKALASAKQKAAKETERMLEAAHKDAKKIRASNSAEISKVAGSVFAKVFGDLF